METVKKGLCLVSMTVRTYKRNCDLAHSVLITILSAMDIILKIYILHAKMTCFSLMLSICFISMSLGLGVVD